MTEKAYPTENKVQLETAGSTRKRGVFAIETSVTVQ